MSDLPVVLPTLPPAPVLPEEKLVQLAREVVMNIHPLHAILNRYMIEQSQYDVHVKDSPFFKRVVDQYRIEWESATSTSQRIKIKAQVALEDSLLTLAARMVNKDEDLGKATETAKLFARVAGVDGADKLQGTGEKVIIEINLGADTQIKFEKEPAALVIEGEAIKETN